MNRREFLSRTARAGLASAALATLPPLLRDSLAKTAAPHLIERNQRPKHWETTLEALDANFYTPVEDFFVRGHLGDGGRLDGDAAIDVQGMVKKKGVISVAKLQTMPRHEMAVTLECAGNGRGLYRLPNTSGTQWEHGAVGTGLWRGVKFSDVLDLLDVDPQATDVWLKGADWLGIGSLPAFERSIPIAKARADALLAFELNGVPLPAFHGGPLRLVVPGWYGMAWTKWPESIRLENRPSDGHFMARSYRWVYPGDDPAKAPPVERMRVKSLVTSHADGARVARRPFTVAGWAWSGEGALTRVEVSTDRLSTWHVAKLGPARGEFAWRRWEFPMVPRAGALPIAVRATDASGATQPVAARPNLSGYGNNSIHQVTLHVA